MRHNNISSNIWSVRMNDSCPITPHHRPVNTQGFCSTSSAVSFSMGVLGSWSLSAFTIPSYDTSKGNRTLCQVISHRRIPPHLLRYSSFGVLRYCWQLQDIKKSQWHMDPTWAALVELSWTRCFWNQTSWKVECGIWQRTPWSRQFKSFNDLTEMCFSTHKGSSYFEQACLTKLVYVFIVWSCNVILAFTLNICPAYFCWKKSIYFNRAYLNF